MIHLRRSLVLTIAAFYLLFASTAATTARAQQPASFRAPAVPLVTHDPYFSVWSMDDRLTDGWSKHWTGTVHGMWGMARIDGKLHRFMGPQPPTGRPSRNQFGLETVPPPMTQVGLEVLPTRTIYRFEAGGVRLTLTFMTPLLPHNLEVLARPVTYLVWEVQAIDGKTHTASLYFDASTQWAVNTPEQKVVWSRFKAGDLSVLRIGTEEQPILGKSGDNLRIDWGHLYVAVPRQGVSSDVITSHRAARESFANTGTLPDTDDLRVVLQK